MDVLVIGFLFVAKNGKLSHGDSRPRASARRAATEDAFPAQPDLHSTIPEDRVLAGWRRAVCVAGYRLLRCRPAETPIRWEEVAQFSPIWWRKLTSASRWDIA